MITTTLAYLANRYWTYRHHTRSALRREYTLFFGFNLVGMIIQSGSVGIAKYGFNLSHLLGGAVEHSKSGENLLNPGLLIMVTTLAAAGVATIFRFWAYRTFVFLKPPVDGHEAAIAELDVAAGFAELSTEADLDAELASELDKQQRADRR